ncbi:MAG: hypothetical protein NVSMB45_15850 [Ginsengibacter sp.]
MVVKNEIVKAGLTPVSVNLGEVEIKETISPAEKEKLNRQLQKFDFLLIEDKKARLIEKIKNEIINLIHYDAIPLNEKLSVFLAEKLLHDYTYLSNIFSEVEGITIEKYFILQKIEKVKELLKYDELSVSEIAYRLGYSSVGYLSSQFKKETGLSPSFYKLQKKIGRKNIDKM